MPDSCHKVLFEIRDEIETAIQNFVKESSVARYWI